MDGWEGLSHGILEAKLPLIRVWTGVLCSKQLLAVLLFYDVIDGERVPIRTV